MRYLIILLTAFLVTNQTFSKISATAAGLKVAQIMESANTGFVGEESKMELVLIDAKGTKIVRSLKGMSKEVKNDGDMSISVFLNPKDVQGTKMLTHSHKSDDDDQWLYLPSLRRVKRISSRSKSSSFMASEFSYEDLGSQEIEKYNFKLLKQNKSVWLLERKPKQKSGYSKMVLEVSKKYKSAVKVKYYDRKGELLKVAESTKWKQYLINGKKMWRANRIHMKNVQTKKESIFTWANRKIGVNHPKRLFRKSALK